MLRRVSIAHVLLQAYALLAPQPPLQAPVHTTRATHAHAAQIVKPVRRRRTRLAAVPVQRSDDCDDDVRPPSLWPDPEVLLVVTCYFLQGALGLSRLALNFYLKDELGLSPADLAALTGLASAPWVVKPLYGLLSDSTPLLGYRRKSYLALSGVLGALSFAAMATVASGATEALLFANLVASAAVALSDVVVDSLVVEKARDEAEAASLQSVAWGSRYVGAIGAALLSGEAIRVLGARGCFGATALLPLLLTAVALTVREPPSERADGAAWREAGAVLGRLRDALLSPEILRPAAFLFLWQATPNCGSAFFFFSTASVDAGGLGFDPDFLGRASAAGSVAGLVGVAAYNGLFKEARLSSVILWSSVASAIIGLAPLALVSHANRAWGLDDRLFSLGDDVIQSALGEVGFLPLLVLAAKICPPGIEGALFAALMSIFNLGGIVSTEAGALLTDAFHVSETDFSNLSPLIFTCAASSLLPLFFLGWVRGAEDSDDDITA
mmetsp:Transcript_2775/g.8101  ORF Transcript_2775/g.8101 Transcript_2775/m.8101 type:complete len:497 (-) Transcript_2775:47-1537(-)